MPPARAVALLLALAGCGYGPGARIGQPVLPGEDVERLVRGHAFVGRTEAGAPIEVYYREDGAAFIRGRSPAGIPFQDSGRWWVQADRLCTRYEQVRGRQSICEWVTYRGETLRTYAPAGDPSAEGRLQASPPAGIGRLPLVPPQSSSGGS